MNNLLSENKNITEYQNIKGLMRVWEKQGKTRKIKKNKFFLGGYNYFSQFYNE